MPGYVIDQEAHKNFIAADEATIDNIVDKSFWSFKMDPETSAFTATEIDDSSAVMIPEYDSYSINGNQTWFWTKKNLDFYWDSTRPGHLIMEVF